MAPHDQPPVPPPGAKVLPFPHPLGPDGITDLCDRMHALLSDTAPPAHPGPVICDVSAVRTPDPTVLDALARLQLTARRLGHRMWLAGASTRLCALLVLTGLDEVLPLAEALQPPGAPPPAAAPRPRALHPPGAGSGPG